MTAVRHRAGCNRRGGAATGKVPRSVDWTNRPRGGQQKRKTADPYPRKGVVDGFLEYRMESYPTGVRAFTPSPPLPSPALAARPTEAPWLATPLDLRQDPRVLAFTAEVMISGLAPSHRLALALAVDVTFSLWAWATRHEPDGTLAGVAPVVIAGAVGWEGDPGSLWASLTRSGIVDVFGTITGWASTGGRRGARMSAMALPARPEVTTPVFGPSQRGRRLGLGPDDRKARRQWLDRRRKSAKSASARFREVPPTFRELSANLEESSRNADLLAPSLLEVEKEKELSHAYALTREGAETRPARAMHPAWSHPAVITWLEVCGISQPREAQATAIAGNIGEDSASLTLWEDVCRYAMRNGHNPGAIDWMFKRFERLKLGQKPAPKRQLTDRERAENERPFTQLIGHSTDFQGSAPAESAPENTEISCATGGDSAPATLPPAREWKVLSPKEEQAWKETQRTYRAEKRIPAYTSIDMDLVRAWDAERKAKEAEATGRPVGSSRATISEYRGRPVGSIREALGTLGVGGGAN